VAVLVAVGLTEGVAVGLVVGVAVLQLKPAMTVNAPQATFKKSKPLLLVSFAELRTMIFPLAGLVSVLPSKQRELR